MSGQVLGEPEAEIPLTRRAIVFTPRDIAADSESVINPTVKFLRWPLPNAPEDALMEPHGTPPGEMVKNLIFTIS